MFRCARFVWVGWLVAMAADTFAQTTDPREAEAVGESISYVFATDLGSGVYDLDGRTLQIYRFNFKHDLRETREGQLGVRIRVPVTAGFFDFNPLDVIESGPPTRIDSLGVVPGLEFDHLLKNDWHLVPYVRAGFSVASSSVDGWLFGTGVRLEKRDEVAGWDRFLRSELAYAGVNYRDDAPNDEFLRLRQGADFTRVVGPAWRERRLEIGGYGIFDYVADPPTVPVEGGRQRPVQAEFGVTFATQPRLKVWRLSLPRLGVGYRVAGDLSAWRVVIGAPF